MGWMYGENVIVPQIDPTVYQKKFEMDTVSCKHCGACIKIVVISGTHKEIETDYRCGCCNGPVCKYCAHVMRRAGGACTGSFRERIELAMKKLDGNYLRAGRRIR